MAGKASKQASQSSHGYTGSECNSGGYISHHDRLKDVPEVSDLDTVDMVKIKQLQELFPHKSESNLVHIVKSHRMKSIELLVEQLVIEDTTGNQCTQELPLEVYKLYEILPYLSLEEIQQEYVSNDKNFELTVLKLSQSEDKSDTNNATKLARLCHQSEQVAAEYLESSDGDYTKALINLVLHEVNLQKPEDTISPKTFSRVQRHKAKPNTKPSYVFRQSNREVVELNQLYEDSDEMKLISKEFLQKLLISVKGDLNKLIEITGLIFECQYQNLTFEEMWNLNDDKMKYSEVVSTSKKPLNQVRLTNTTKNVKRVLPFISTSKGSRASSQSFSPITGQGPISSNPISSNPTSSKAQVIQNYHSTGRLDLHQLLVDEAMSISKQIINEWWQSEHVMRVNEGKLHKYGNLVMFVDPLQVVTGRGLHSSGGKPKIKLRVGKFLKENLYVYEEETWGYIISGKRK